jgi:hypothetical protein
VLLDGLAARDPRDPRTHFALEGALVLGKQVFDGCDLGALSDEDRERWQRDRPLLEVAGRVRALRFEAASRAILTGNK